MQHDVHSVETKEAARTFCRISSLQSDNDRAVAVQETTVWHQACPIHECLRECLGENVSCS